MKVARLHPAPVSHILELVTQFSMSFIKSRFASMPNVGWWAEFGILQSVSSNLVKPLS